VGHKAPLPNHPETTQKRFYDLNKSPIISPYTGEEVVIETGKTRTMVADAADAQNKAKAAEAEDEDLVLDDEDDDVTMTTTCRSTKSPTSPHQTTIRNFRGIRVGLPLDLARPAA